MSIAVPQSPAASSRSGAGAEGERTSLPVMIRIPDLYPAPAPTDDTKAELTVISAPATPLPEVKPVEIKPAEKKPAEKKPTSAVTKPPFQQAVSRRSQKAAFSPLAIVVGVALVGCVLAATLLRQETPADSATPESQASPGQIAVDIAPGTETRLPYDLNEPVSLRAEVPAPPQTETEPTAMPWPRQPTTDGGVAPATQTTPPPGGPSLAPPTNNSQIGTLREPAFEARRPTAPSVEFEGTITKPEFRSHYERY